MEDKGMDLDDYDLVLELEEDLKKYGLRLRRASPRPHKRDIMEVWCDDTPLKREIRTVVQARVWMDGFIAGANFIKEIDPGALVGLHNLAKNSNGT